MVPKRDEVWSSARRITLRDTGIEHPPSRTGGHLQTTRMVVSQTPYLRHRTLCTIETEEPEYTEPQRSLTGRRRCLYSGLLQIRTSLLSKSAYPNQDPPVEIEVNAERGQVVLRGEDFWLRQPSQLASVLYERNE